ncbi:MAG TPA: protein kinase [Bryobacteraceae bacterium]|nr:protein kinase [Bryobacteraceae bacterium]
MTPQRFQQLRNVFEAAMERQESDRAAFVAEACREDEDLRQEVARLIEANDATVTLRAWPQATATGADPGSREGRRIGDYEVLRQLGRGGMGSVYLASRADASFHKQVAIKVLRSESGANDILRRFNRERQILAQMDHPNIARLLDAGETDDGLPYFVMEYVEGRAVTAHADEKRLTIPERLVLFRQICDAVDYAHQRKIVHRDLKPGNILVTADGQVKLLDFGIARLVEQQSGAADFTQTGMWLMTPEYASPEQVRGEAAGRASDIYSLGVVLFELLTGHRPYHLPNRIFYEVVRVICEEPPTRPSAIIVRPLEIKTADGNPATLPPEAVGRLRQVALSGLKQQLSGDLDNILLKALEKSPVNRYSTALQFRADVDRHLQGQPVSARGDSNWYRLGKLISQHRAALIVAAMLIAALGSGAIAVRRSLAWWLAGGAALLAIWHAATDRRIGGKIAESPLWKAPFVVLVTGTGLISIFGPQKWGAVFLGINIVLALIALGLLTAYLFRERWAGPLLLVFGDNVEASRIGLAINMTSMPYNLMRLLIPKIRAHQPLDLTDFACLTWLVAVSALLAAARKQEIRRDGFMSVGRLIRWSRVASWAWEDVYEPGPITAPLSGPSLDPVLRLNLHQSIKFLPPVRFRIPRKQRGEVEAILRRQLGEWPAGGE